MPPLYRPRVSPTFVERFERLSNDDQDEVQRYINLLCIDPFADHEVKFIVELPEGRVWYYDTGDLWVSYKLEGNDEFYLLSCGRRRGKIGPHIL